MKENTSQKNSEKHDERECAGDYLSAQKNTANPSAAGLLTPADGLAVESSTDKTTNIQDRKDSMAVSVTRHASTPYIAKFQNQIIFGYLKPESVARIMRIGPCSQNWPLPIDF